MRRWLKRFIRWLSTVDVCPRCGSDHLIGIIIDGYPVRLCLACDHWGFVKR